MKELIQKDHTVYEVLTRYPELKPVLQELSPKFKKLDNPLAFNTLARVTTLEKAAKIGGVYLKEMLYRLNEALGLGAEYLSMEKTATAESLQKGEALKKVVELIGTKTKTKEGESTPPPWFPHAQTFPKVDLRILEVDPFNKVMQLAEGVEVGGGLILIQAFEPVPLINHLMHKGFLSYTECVSAKEYWVYLLKEK